MTDYGGYKSLAAGALYVAQEAKLLQRLAELEAEVEKLRGVSKYYITAHYEAVYETKAKNEKEALEWFDKHGPGALPHSRKLTNVNARRAT